MKSFVLFLCLVPLSFCRVSFTTSEVLDTVDLATIDTASFGCTKGCAVFSPTINPNVVITDSTGKELTSLYDLARLSNADYYELPASTAKYILKNKGAGHPIFILYVVQKGAPHYGSHVVFVDATYKAQLTTKTNYIATVLSTTGAIRVTDFAGDFSGGLPTIHATGFDQIDSTSCKPVFAAISTRTLSNTVVPIYSPIATINLKSVGDKSVIVSGSTDFVSSTEKDSSAVYTSPGYVGCDNVGDSLYTAVAPISILQSTFAMTDSRGLSTTVNGAYSIEKEADAISLTVNDDVQKLYGKSKKISKSYDSTSMKIAVYWKKREGSTDNFAIQIDVVGKYDGSVTTSRPITTTSEGTTTAISLITILTLAFAV